MSPPVAWVLQQAEVSGGPRLLLLTMALASGEDGSCAVATRELARQAAMSERQTRTLLGRLEAAGAIEAQAGRPVRYRLRLERPQVCCDGAAHLRRAVPPRTARPSAASVAPAPAGEPREAVAREVLPPVVLRPEELADEPPVREGPTPRPVGLQRFTLSGDLPPPEQDTYRLPLDPQVWQMSPELGALLTQLVPGMKWRNRSGSGAPDWYGVVSALGDRGTWRRWIERLESERASLPEGKHLNQFVAAELATEVAAQMRRERGKGQPAMTPEEAERRRQAKRQYLQEYQQKLQSGGARG